VPGNLPIEAFLEPITDGTSLFAELQGKRSGRWTCEVLSGRRSGT
jgi:hypothetical protein